MGLNEINFEESHLRRIAKIAYDLTGINLPDSKMPLIYSRLIKRVRALGMTGFEEYCDLIVSPGGEDEREHLFSALTTNVTSFFRESHHFDFLRETVLPPLIDRARKQERVRLWSAACSSGEEPYSIAMTLLDCCPDPAGLNLKLLATDIDPKILRTAKTGRYPREALEKIPKQYQGFFDLSDPDWVTAGPKLRSNIAFRRLNLIGDWPFKGQFDVIVCRNVAIYFDREVQDKVWQSFARVMKPGGYLMIGHSERIFGEAAKAFEPAGITTYRRV